jgi:hypothetical protein
MERYQMEHARWNDTRWKHARWKHVRAVIRHLRATNDVERKTETFTYEPLRKQPTGHLSE